MRCAVIGHPVAHSLSPAIHRAAYQVLGLEWSYQAIDVEPGGLRAFIEGLDGSWRGLSVTMPHKADLVELGETDATVDMLGAANTWVCRDGTTIVSWTVRASATSRRLRPLPSQSFRIGASAVQPHSLDGSSRFLDKAC
jgi:shikimate 5-dehydrogenase